MQPCISCNERTSIKFKGKALCSNCCISISKTNLVPAERLLKHPTNNISCEFCFSIPKFLDLSTDPYKIVCESCSIYSKTTVTLEWLDLIQLSGNPKIVEKRYDLLSILNYNCDEIIESIDRYIIDSTHTYSICRQQIDLSESENLQTIEAFEQQLTQRFTQVMASPNRIARLVFLKNLEVFQNQIISVSLLKSDELRKTILENMNTDLQIKRVADYFN